jgi:hypothetical protein
MQDVMGESIPDSSLINAARTHNYDPDAAIDALLNAKRIPPGFRGIQAEIPKIQPNRERLTGNLEGDLLTLMLAHCLDLSISLDLAFHSNKLQQSALPL